MPERDLRLPQPSGPLPGRSFLSSRAGPFAPLLPTHTEGPQKGRVTTEHAVPLWIGASQVPAAEFFLAASPAPANVRQQVGRTQIGSWLIGWFSSSPTERARLQSFCAIGHRPRRGRPGGSWLGRAGGLGGRGAGTPPRKSRAPGAGAAPPPAPNAVRRPPPRSAPLTLRLGLRRRPLTRSAPAHSIRTCRRTLSITEATT